MIPMSADEVKEFWHGFCKRQGVSDALRAAGDRKIDENPDYWADQTMGELLEHLTGKPASTPKPGRR